MPSALVTAVTILAITANIAFVWPQAIKILRTGNLTGVSAGTWTISITLFSVWAAYATATAYWPLAFANASCLVAAVLIMVAGTRNGWHPRWALLSLAGVTAATIAGIYTPLILATVMTAAGIALRIPQLITLTRNPDPSGVSATTWILGATTAAAWLIVSISKHATAVIIANSTALTMTLILLAILYWRRHQHTQPTT